MTYREKLAQEHPEYVRPGAIAGMKGCPGTYFVIPDDVKPCVIHQTVNDDICSACWDREIPETGKATNVSHVLNPDDKAAILGTIKDSGERRQFETGAVRDIQEGKGRCDLMPLGVVYNFLKQIRGDAAMPIEYIRIFQESGDTMGLYEAIKFFMGYNMAWGLECSMLLEVAKHFEEGAKKYGENNWQKGLPVNCYIDSAVRHYLKWLRGDKDEPHDRAFVWNLMCCIWEVDFSPRAKENDRGRESIDILESCTESVCYEDCPIGLFEYEGERYAKGNNCCINLRTGKTHGFMPFIMVHPVPDENKLCEVMYVEKGPFLTTDIRKAKNFTLEDLGGRMVFVEKMHDDTREDTIDISTDDYVRLGDAPIGLFLFDGQLYTKVSDVLAIQIVTGSPIYYDHDILVIPIQIEVEENDND